MQRRILMVHDGTLLELTNGSGPNCWFRETELCMDCTASTKLVRMCQESRRLLDLIGWMWKEVSMG